MRIRNKIVYLFSAFWLLSFPAYALNSITVMADGGMSAVIAKIARDYSRDKQVVVNTSFATSRADEAQIIGGADADVLITPKQSWLDRLKEKGLVDIYSQTKVAAKGQSDYFAVVIAGDNMDEARRFLEYLKSPDVQEELKENGFN